MARDFQWLMHHLLPINEKIRGCELIFPDTVLFQRGKPKVIIRNDKEYCLMAVRQMSKLNLQSIYKDFSNVVRDRKKDFAGPFLKMYGNSFQKAKSSEILNVLNQGSFNSESKYQYLSLMPYFRVLSQEDRCNLSYSLPKICTLPPTFYNLNNLKRDR
jgi:hypothetical protein